VKNEVFRKALFGYNKSDVVSYMDKASIEFGNRVKQLEDENFELREKIKELESVKEEFQIRKESISNAFLLAENKANEIIEEAKNNAIKVKNEYQVQVAEEAEKLRSIKNQVADIRTYLADAITKFSAELASKINE